MLLGDYGSNERFRVWWYDHRWPMDHFIYQALLYQCSQQNRRSHWRRKLDWRTKFSGMVPWITKQFTNLFLKRIANCEKWNTRNLMLNNLAQFSAPKLPHWLKNFKQRTSLKERWVRGNGAQSLHERGRKRRVPYKRSQSCPTKASSVSRVL